jgi:chaperonin GroEL
MAARRVRHDGDARAALLAGIDAVADAVGITLGPRGRTVLLNRSPNPALGEAARLTVTDDGVTVAREIVLADPFANQGALLVREVAAATQAAAGDGTTTATLLARALVRAGAAAIAAGADPVALRRGIERAAGQALADVRERQAMPVTTAQQTTQVASVAAGDAVVGALVAEAFERVGAEGMVNVEGGSTTALQLDVVEGLRWDHGYIAPDMVTDRERREAVLHDAYVLLVDAKLADAHPLLPVIEQVKAAGGALLVVAREVEGEALAMLLVNKLLGQLESVAVRAPGFALRRRRMLDDMAVYTGGVTVSEETGLTLQGLTLAELGRARRAVAELDQTTLIGGGGDPAQIRARREHLRGEMERTPIQFQAKVLKERLDRLSGQIARLLVGAVTETEIGERMLRVDDAVQAVRAALAGGLVPGGGAALLAARGAIDTAGLSADERTGAELVRRALAEPARQIAANSGFDGATAVARSAALAPGHGLDARTGEYVDLVAAGVVDPARVTCAALESAASLAKTVLLADAIVAEVS